MKIGTTELVKFKRLKGRLKLSLWQAIGLLESLWMFTAKNAPSGDIGRFTDEDIAFGIEWEGDSVELIQTLIETHWIDKNEQHRLVIHDWCDHVPNWLRGNFAKHGKSFAVEVAKQPAKQVTKQRAKQPAKHVAEQAAYSTLPPIQFNSSHVNSSLGDAHAREEYETPQTGIGPTALDGMEFMQMWNEIAVKRPGPGGYARFTGKAIAGEDWTKFKAIWSPGFLESTKTALESTPEAGTGKQSAITLDSFLSFSGIRDTILGFASSGPKKTGSTFNEEWDRAAKKEFERRRNEAAAKTAAKTPQSQAVAS